MENKYQSEAGELVAVERDVGHTAGRKLAVRQGVSGVKLVGNADAQNNVAQGHVTLAFLRLIHEHAVFPKQRPSAPAIRNETVTQLPFVDTTAKPGHLDGGSVLRALDPARSLSMVAPTENPIQWNAFVLKFAISLVGSRRLNVLNWLRALFLLFLLEMLRLSGWRSWLRM